MKKRKQFICTFFLVFCGIIVLSGQENNQMLTFEEAFQMMTEQNPGIQRAKQQIKQKEYELKAKKGLYMPRVSLSAKAVSMSDMLHLDLTPVKDAITPLYNTLGTYGVYSGVPNPDPATNTVVPVLSDDQSTAAVREKLLEAGNEISNANWDEVIQEKNFATVSADVMWPLFTGGKIKGANDAADAELAISKEELRQTEGDLLTELATRYYGLTLGMQVLKVRQQMMDIADQHYIDAQKLFDNGMIAKVELLHARVSKNEAERQLKEAKRNIEIVHSGLEATLSPDSTFNILPASHLFINKELQDISYWVNKAYETNPQLKKINGKRELVNINNKVNKGEYLPTIAMIGSYNLAEKNLSPYMPDWIVGVGLKWPVFEGLGRKNKIKAGNTLENQVNFAEQKAYSDIKAYITKLHETLQMQMEQRNELESTLELAQEYAESTQKAFKEGLATSTSVVEAYTKVAQVKALRLKVFYNYDVTLAQLIQTAGVPEQYTAFCKGNNTITESLIN
ncbi:hypothetical protein GM418_00905 [Maribellus comscasis]|uniref:TolC family protein n=1 Tax=Maribellus comscasis TaxID=2681766 RepID=A0A6I6JWX3_9BACT|nr:TolC family protein [Maribellus comscasis]QGY42264.1 hypothetical protein GM418_00905 [Maribellus comscasis]